MTRMKQRYGLMFTDYTLKEVTLVVRESLTVPIYAEQLKDPFRNSDQVYLAFSRLNESAVEIFIALHLDGKNRIQELHTVSIGSMTTSIVHPREVFRAAILGGAVGIIAVHNHPSGDPAPSAEDLAITKRLVEVGKLVGIGVLDHVIVGDGAYFSFKDEGMF